MARIGLINGGGYQDIPEGEHVLKVTKVEYQQEYGQVFITLQNVNGLTCVERFSLLNQDDSPNEKALAAFSFFAKTVMNDFTMDDIDPEELVGHYLRAEVIHNQVPSNKEPGKMMTFVNLGKKTPADGFDGEPAPAPKAGIDLSALLNG